MIIKAVLLAAGESTRMGPDNKLLLPLAGKTVLRHMVDTLLAAELDEVIVVLGHQSHAARAVLAGLPIKVVINTHYQQGQMSSVHAGVSAIEEDCDGILIGLSDQPLLTVADIHQLVSGFEQRSQGSIVVPTYQGRRGNPIILDGAYRHNLIVGGQNLGCRRLIEKHPEAVTTLAFDQDHVVVDMDTPEAYQVVKQRLECSSLND